MKRSAFKILAILFACIFHISIYGYSPVDGDKEYEKVIKKELKGKPEHEEYVNKLVDGFNLT